MIATRQILYWQIILWSVCRILTRLQEQEKNGMGKSRRLYEGGSMKELTVREATNIIKKDMEAIYNPRILEQILNILGHEDKVFEKHKCCGSKDYNRHKCWCINGE